jgi:hypothetical protein
MTRIAMRRIANHTSIYDSIDIFLVLVGGIQRNGSNGAYCKGEAEDVPHLECRCAENCLLEFKDCRIVWFMELRKYKIPCREEANKQEDI